MGRLSLPKPYKNAYIASAESERIEAPGAEDAPSSSAMEYGEGYPIPRRLGSLGERRELPSGVRGGAAAENAF